MRRPRSRRIGGPIPSGPRPAAGRSSVRRPSRARGGGVGSPAGRLRPRRDRGMHCSTATRPTPARWSRRRWPRWSGLGDQGATGVDLSPAGEPRAAVESLLALDAETLTQLAVVEELVAGWTALDSPVRAAETWPPSPAASGTSRSSPVRVWKPRTTLGGRDDADAWLTIAADTLPNDPRVMRSPRRSRRSGAARPAPGSGRPPGRGSAEMSSTIDRNDDPRGVGRRVDEGHREFGRLLDRARAERDPLRYRRRRSRRTRPPRR